VRSVGAILSRSSESSLAWLRQWPRWIDNFLPLPTIADVRWRQLRERYSLATESVLKDALTARLQVTDKRAAKS